MTDVVKRRRYPVRQDVDLAYEPMTIEDAEEFHRRMMRAPVIRPMKTTTKEPEVSTDSKNDGRITQYERGQLVGIRNAQAYIKGLRAGLTPTADVYEARLRDELECVIAGLDELVESI